MGNKTVKWKYGEKLLVQAVLDEELYKLIDDNFFVSGWEFSETVHDRNGNQVSLHCCQVMANFCMQQVHNVCFVPFLYAVGIHCVFCVCTGGGESSTGGHAVTVYRKRCLSKQKVSVVHAFTQISI